MFNIALIIRKAYIDWRCFAGRQRHFGARGVREDDFIVDKNDIH